MRIPLSKIYRAFSELDRFSDEECERYVRYVSQQRQPTRFLIGVVPAVVCVAVIAVLVLMEVYAGPAVRSARDWVNSIVDMIAPDMTEDLADMVFLLFWLLMLIGMPYIVMLMTRDWHLRRGIRGRLETAHCPSCRQGLLGLPLIAGARLPTVRCPECGTVLILEEIGVTPDDLLVRPDGAAPL